MENLWIPACILFILLFLYTLYRCAKIQQKFNDNFSELMRLERFKKEVDFIIFEEHANRPEATILTDLENISKALEDTLVYSREADAKNEALTKTLEAVRNTGIHKNTIISRQKKKILEYKNAHEGLRASNLQKEYGHFTTLL